MPAISLVFGENLVRPPDCPLFLLNQSKLTVTSIDNFHWCFSYRTASDWTTSRVSFWTFNDGNFLSLNGGLRLKKGRVQGL